MSILNVKIVQDYIRMCNDGWLQGWHERNGGNLTYRMKAEEVEACRPFFKEPGPWSTWALPVRTWPVSTSSPPVPASSSVM